MITSLIIILIVVLKVIFATLSERKVQAAGQRRIGPNYVGYQGLLQPLTDGLKLILKEKIIPSQVNGILFVLSPFFFFGISLMNWAVLPLHSGVAILDKEGQSVLYTLMLSEVSILGILYAGYTSNSKYSLIGTLRAIAQKISYSVTLSLCIICLLLALGTLDYSTIQESPKLIYAFFPLSFILAVSFTAELGRSPFDLLEAESELVSGHFTEYSSIAFAFFFLAEYSKMQFKGALYSVLLLGFSNPVPFLLFLFILRASFPRVRIDHVISFNWSHLLPLLTGFLIAIYVLQIFIY